MAPEPLEFHAIVTNDKANLYLVNGWSAGCVESSEQFCLCNESESTNEKTLTISNMELYSEHEQLPLFLTITFMDAMKLSRLNMKVGARFVEVYYPDPVDPASFVYVKTIRGTNAPNSDSSDKSPYLHEYTVETFGGQRVSSLRLKFLSFKSGISNRDTTTNRCCFIDSMTFVLSLGLSTDQSAIPAPPPVAAYDLKSTMQASSSSSVAATSSSMAPQILAGLLKSSLQPRPPAVPVVPPVVLPSPLSLSALQPMLIAMSAMFDEKLKPLQQQLDRLESKVEQLTAIHQKLLSESDTNNSNNES